MNTAASGQTRYWPLILMAAAMMMVTMRSRSPARSPTARAPAGYWPPAWC